jgi:hypothetical protein
VITSLRFYLFPTTFKASFLHPTEKDQTTEIASQKFYRFAISSLMYLFTMTRLCRQRFGKPSRDRILYHRVGIYVWREPRIMLLSKLQPSHRYRVHYSLRSIKEAVWVKGFINDLSTSVNQFLHVAFHKFSLLTVFMPVTDIDLARVFSGIRKRFIPRRPKRQRKYNSHLVGWFSVSESRITFSTLAAPFCQRDTNNSKQLLSLVKSNILVCCDRQTQILRGDINQPC